MTALFDTLAEAELARDRLARSSLDAQKLAIEPQSPAATGGQQPGIFDALATMLVPEISARASFLVTAEVPEAEADTAIRLLDETKREPIVLKGGFLIAEQMVELAETAEELVVTKEPFVREEFVLRKHAEEHVEIVHETLRHTEVEVEKIPSPPR